MKSLSKLMLVGALLCITPLVASEQFYQVNVEVDLRCPMSQELKTFVDSIPKNESETIDYQEWKISFVENMTRLIELVESDNLVDASWSVGVDYE